MCEKRKFEGQYALLKSEMKMSILRAWNPWNESCYITISSGWRSFKEGRLHVNNPVINAALSRSQNSPVKLENADKNKLNLTSVWDHMMDLLCLAVLLFTTMQLQKTVLLHICLHPCLRLRPLCISCHRFERDLPGAAQQSQGLEMFGISVCMVVQPLF